MIVAEILGRWFLSSSADGSLHDELYVNSGSGHWQTISYKGLSCPLPYCNDECCHCDPEHSGEAVCLCKCGARLIKISNAYTSVEIC